MFDTIEKSSLSFFLITLFLFFFLLSSHASALSEEEKGFLSMYFTEEELVVISSTRSLKSIARVAENVEVVTAGDIELANAHTLSDVLFGINGVQINSAGPGVGLGDTVFIQGSGAQHVAVFLDGIPLNTISDNNVPAGLYPVQMIEKIEIIKGPASSTWGSSLGGVINVITKSPRPEGGKGTISASYGERATGDYRVELTGKAERFGYYLTAARLQSNGFGPFFPSSRNDLFTKLTYDLPNKGKVLFTFFYAKNRTGQGADRESGVSFNLRAEHLISSLALTSPVTDNLNFSLSLHAVVLSPIILINQMEDNAELEKSVFFQKDYGLSAKLTYTSGAHAVVGGLDLDNGTLKSSSVIPGDHTLSRHAVFLNDTIVMGDLSVTPGLRLDHTNIFGDVVSPAIGATYSLTSRTLLRAVVARGYSYPTFAQLFVQRIFARGNPELRPEKVLSYQVGVETTALKYLWLKLSAFRHDIKDGIMGVTTEDGMALTTVNMASLRRQGFEAEARTVPFFHTAFFAGATFVDTNDRRTGEELQDIPRYTYTIGLKYDDEKGLRALLKGFYIWWNQGEQSRANYNAMIVDFNLTKRIYRYKERSAEAFLSAHNLFNGSQYWINIFPNAARWFEAGLRYKF